MPPTPIYGERLNANYLLISGVFLFALAVGIVPGIVLDGLWWLTILYLALTIGIIVSFFQMKVTLFKDRLVIKFGLFYRKSIAIKEMQAYSPYKISHPIRTYGGWGIRKGKDGTFALTQAFFREGVKLETPDKTFVISSQNPEGLCTAIKSVKG